MTVNDYINVCIQFNTDTQDSVFASTIRSSTTAPKIGNGMRTAIITRLVLT